MVYCTYGTTTGQIGNFANEILQKQNIEISAYFSVKMPDTWTPTFNLSNKEHVRKINEKAELQKNSVIDKIINRAIGDYMQRKVPMPIAKWFYNMEYDTMKTSHFHVENTCVGCGLCAQKCPISAIDITNKQPVWNQSSVLYAFLAYTIVLNLQFNTVKERKTWTMVHFPLSVKENKV